MSYCRFSSDNFQSDVYAYESVYGGYMVHVANRRLVATVSPLIEDQGPDALCTSYLKQIQELKEAEWEPIGLPHDGNTFHVDILDELYDLLTDLSDTGYRVPQHAFDRIKEEMK